MINFMGYTEKQLREIIELWEQKSKIPTKHIMTRAEAIALLKKHTPMVENAARIIDFYVEAGMLEVKEEELNWNMPLYIIGQKGIKLDVLYLGYGYRGKRLVQIEDDLTVDGSQPKIYSPDENGYVVQFDTKIFN